MHLGDNKEDATGSNVHLAGEQGGAGQTTVAKKLIFRRRQNGSHQY